MKIAETPQPPYYAVIFTSIKSDNTKGYDAMSDKMIELVTQQKGFLGFESAFNELEIALSALLYTAINKPTTQIAYAIYFSPTHHQENLSLLHRNYFQNPRLAFHIRTFLRRS